MTRREREAALARLEARVVRCRACPRLVAWREEVARVKVRRFAEEEYWGKPLPGFGDPHARLLVVGLAPAAHGGNRTGRMFTGDDSGAWLFRELHAAGFADRPDSLRRGDGMTLHDCYISAACRCAPPGNKPERGELEACRPFLLDTVRLLDRVRVVVGLGKVGFDAAVDACREAGRAEFSARPPFAHGAMRHSAGLTFIASFHPSRQNTFTGRLTRPMFRQIFRKARRTLERVV